MIAIIGFLLLIAVVGILVYVLVIQRAVPGIVEQRVGILEDLPPDVGRWIVDTSSEDGQASLQRGEKLEVRLYFDQNNPGRLTRQRRYKNGAGEILRADPDEHIKRKRVKG